MATADDDPYQFYGYENWNLPQARQGFAANGGGTGGGGGFVVRPNTGAIAALIGGLMSLGAMAFSALNTASVNTRVGALDDDVRDNIRRIAALEARRAGGGSNGSSDTDTDTDRDLERLEEDIETRQKKLTQT